METRARGQGLKRIITKFWVWLGGETSASSSPFTESETSPFTDGSPDPSPILGSSNTHFQNYDTQDVPQARPKKSAKTSPQFTLTVKEGDTLFNIADSVNVSVQALIQINQLRSQKIYIGQELVLPDTATPPPNHLEKSSRLQAPPPQNATQQPSRQENSQLTIGPDPRPRVQGKLDLQLPSDKQKNASKPATQPQSANKATPSPISIEAFRRKRSDNETVTSHDGSNSDRPQPQKPHSESKKTPSTSNQPSSSPKKPISKPLPTEIPFDSPEVLPENEIYKETPQPLERPKTKSYPQKKASPSKQDQPSRREHGNLSQPQKRPASVTPSPNQNPKETASKTSTPNPVRQPDVSTQEEKHPSKPKSISSDSTPAVQSNDAKQGISSLTKSHLLKLKPPSPEKQAARRSVEETRQTLKNVTKRQVERVDDTASRPRVADSPRSKQQPSHPTQSQFAKNAIQAIYVAYHLLGNAQTLLTINRHLRHSRINAVVIDIKNENGFLSYPSQVPLAATVGANRRLVLDMAKLVSAFKQEGVYTIARIVSFKDSLLSNANPEFAAKQPDGTGQWKDKTGAGWVDPFLADVWQYNIQLAREAVNFGFDEVQFDSLCFPTYDLEGQPQFSQTLSTEARTNAISGFLSAARGALPQSDIKLAMTTTGYVAWRQDDALIGHKLERVGPYLDVLTPVLFPSSFSSGIPNHPNPMDNIQLVIAKSTEQIVQRLVKLAPECKVRPWLQDFPDETFTHHPLGVDDIQAQIQGAVQAQASGYAFWNPQSDYRFEAYRPSTI
ncbi:MAG: putative glycoside hydrolase [Chloroflexota bacterium]